MGIGEAKFGLFLALVAVLYHGAMAQSSSGCTSTLVTLSPCLNYVTGNTSVPSSTCCTRLAAVVKSQPQCLCTFVSGGSSSLGLNINETRAVGLPGTCSVETPSASKCNSGSSPAATSPASSPDSPPADSADDTPTSSTGTTTGSGSKTVPTSVGTSDAGNRRAKFHVTLFSVFIVSWASNAVRF